MFSQLSYYFYHYKLLLSDLTFSFISLSPSMFYYNSLLLNFTIKLYYYSLVILFTNTYSILLPFLYSSLVLGTFYLPHI